MNLPACALLLAVFALASSATFAQEAEAPAVETDHRAAADVKADPGVARLLKAMDTPYTIDDDGDYRILVDLGDERSQIVWVRSAVHEAANQRVREIWTYGYRSSERRIPANVANRLLSQNFELILGAWARSEGNAVLVVKIPADADAEALDAAIDLTASIGDGMEQKLVAGDEL